jgi:hypothetical protein
MEIFKLDKDRYLKIDGDRLEVFNIDEKIENLRYQMSACKENLKQAEGSRITTKGLTSEVAVVVENYNRSLCIPQIKQEIEKIGIEIKVMETV